MREAEAVGAHAIARHQQPAREALLDDVKAVARGRLRDLDHQRVRVLIHLPLQGGTLAEHAAESRGFHAPCRARALDQHSDRRRRDSQRQRDAHHALAADQPHFEGEVAVDQDQQRDERVVGKVDVPDRLAGLIEHVAEAERDRFQVGKQALVIGARQRGKYLVRDGHPLKATP